MCGMKANLVVFLSVIHASIHVHDVLSELVASETGVQCYDCQHDDPDAKRNVVSIQSPVLLWYVWYVVFMFFRTLPD